MEGENNKESFKPNVELVEATIKNRDSSDEMYRLLVTNSLTTVAIHAGGIMKYINPAGLKLIGAKSEDEIIGKNVFKFVHPDYREKALERITYMRETRQPVPWYKEKFLKLNGEAIDVEVSSAVFTLNGQDVYQVMVRDITEEVKFEQIRKAAHDSLEQLNADKDKFFSIIAHDLINPFHTLMGYSEYALQNFDRIPLPKLKDFLDKIHSASRSSYDLLHNLLVWSRIQSGKFEFHPQMIDVSKVAEKVFTWGEHSAFQKDILVINKILFTTGVYADLNMVETILRNLLSNAIKFSHCGSRIVIGRDIVEDKFVRVYVTDTGVGIDNDTMAKLFKIDSQITTKGTSNENGTGLGLILCKEFATMNGGEIGVKSEEGKGSTFFFTLPIYENSIKTE